MIDLAKRFGYDKDLAKSGVKKFIGPDKDNDWLLLRRLPNDEYLSCLTETMQNEGEKLQEMEATDPEAHRKYDTMLQCQVLAKTVLVGWGEGIQVNGKTLEYTVENATKLMVDLDDFRAECVMFARDNKNYPLKMDVEKVKKK